MTRSATPVLKRIAAILGSGLLFAGVAAVAFWAGAPATDTRPSSSGASRTRAGNDPLRSRGDRSALLPLSPSPTGRDRAGGPDGAAGTASPSVADRQENDGEDDETDDVTVDAPSGAGPRQAVGSRAREARDREDDSALFAALDRIERRMARGMVRARDSVVTLEYTSAEGPPDSRRVATGVVINTRGDILSVRIDPPSSRSPDAPAAPPPTIMARDATGRRHPAQWIAADPESGLTLLQIAPRVVRPIQIASDEPILGGQVFIVGNPYGLGHSISRGHIAALDRALRLGSRQLGGLIQVQAPLYPGDSGAAVANMRGQLVGLIRSSLAVSDASNDSSRKENDFGFAIGARDLLWVADQLRARGRVDRAYLGVRIVPTAETAPPTTADESAIEGARLLEVLPGTPAALAGLAPGDAIIAVNGQPVRSSHDLTDRLDQLPSQTPVQLDVIRGEGAYQRRLAMELRTTSRPEAAPAQAARPTTTPDLAAAPAPAPSPTPAPAPAQPRAVTVVPTAATVPAPGPTPKPDPIAPASKPALPATTLQAVPPSSQP